MRSRHVLQRLVLVVCLMAPAPAVAASTVTEGSLPPPASLVSCLPPGVPALATLHASPRRLHIVTTHDESDDLGVAVLVARTYSDDAGHSWNVGTIRGVVVIVDDHSEDETAKDWWVDGGMLTDGIPPRLQNMPTSTCQFHRRGDLS